MTWQTVRFTESREIRIGTLNCLLNVGYLGHIYFTVGEE
jgi:hypothetical protein